MTRTSVREQQSPATSAPGPGVAAPLRIQEVAELVGLTARSIRYYEEMGLLSPSARSAGAYRLFDQLDIDRLRFIKGLRDDAGFSIAEIGRLLEDEAARRLAREELDATDDPVERRRILDGRLASIDDQLASVRAKVARLESMVGELEARRRHVLDHLAELDAAPGPVDPAGRRRTAPVSVASSPR
jgi:DNA-binding transcriptional MerR regulator